MQEDGFGGITFGGTLRPSQVAASQVIQQQIEQGHRKLHIVAPPGSGKTVLGLYVWSNLVRRPALVLSPNSAIQAQWAARTALFDLDGREDEISTDPTEPGLLTSLTYQSVTLPSRGSSDLDAAALLLWCEKLIASGEAHDHATGTAWQDDLRERNPDYYAGRASYYRKQARDAIAEQGDPLWTLHKSARAHISRLSKHGVGLVILDECHHLLHHWGKILAEVDRMFEQPFILGLTATPPEVAEGDPGSSEHYLELLGEVDYEVPVPALVRDHNLAPYQDLVQFVRPEDDELQYIARVDERFDEIVNILQEQRDDGGGNHRIPSLNEWLLEALSDPTTVGIQLKRWPVERGGDARDEFLNAARVHLQHLSVELPENVEPAGKNLLEMEWTPLNLFTPLIDRYVRYGLRLSQSPEDHALGEEAIARFRLLGRQIAETGVRASASPVGRILAYSNAKLRAVIEILRSEMQDLGRNLRAVVVTDYEKTSSMAVVEGVQDEHAGGAIAAFRAIVSDESTDHLNPILMTGSTVLVDDDLVETFLTECNSWIGERNLTITLTDVNEGAYHDIRGSGKDWVPRNYIEMITEMFQRGITQCIVGTRGLLGEGWDASRINCLIDLTTVATDMSINQLRGRSIRLDKEWPEKVANNWDVICLAEEFKKGFDDYDRFKRKHRHLYGVCDDGAIEKGVGHVHPAFKEVPEMGISEGMAIFNQEMIVRGRNRANTRQFWKIGEPFNAEPRAAIELKKEGGVGGFPVSGNMSEEWTEGTLIQAISSAVLGALHEAGHLSVSTHSEGGDRGGGWLRMHLEGCTEDESEIFCTAMQEVLGPLEKPRYVISRSSRFLDPILVHTFLSRYFPFLFKPKDGISERVENVMLHMVPRLLSRKKEEAEMFQRHWNLHVGPGNIVYAKSDAGREVIEIAHEKGKVPDWSMHEKNVFI